MTDAQRLTAILVLHLQYTATNIRIILKLSGVTMGWLLRLVTGGALVVRAPRQFYTVSQKKQDTKLLTITSLNINRFSKFFQ